MEIKVVLDKNAIMPEKAHAIDAGFDIFTPQKLVIPFGRSVVVDTGVHIAIPEGYVGFLKSKSGLNVRNGLVTEGVIDSGYTGSIRVRILNTNFSGVYTFNKGEKITQLVILPIPYVELRQVEELPTTERGNNGFGSTGR